MTDRRTASVLGAFAWSILWVYLLAELAAGGVAACAFLLTQQADEPEVPRRGGEAEGGMGLRAA